ncbi:hypothetical protein FACS189413_00420 [Bacteroidia bacterium]|nr:hypothetical protein FACS189463_0060 [Bacteroidia bacterium]GHU66796.1 hypothetical protein FACS189413_00420 [Bacteroidia bacterium]
MRKMKNLYQYKRILIFGVLAVISVWGNTVQAQSAKTTITVIYNNNGTINNTTSAVSDDASFTVPTNAGGFTGHVWGGGGGGGGSDYDWDTAGGRPGGGGSGAYSGKGFGGTVGYAATIKIGRRGGGGPGSDGGNSSAGRPGGASSITYNGATISAGGGGGGGAGNGSSVGAGGSAGTASGGDTNTNGNTGQGGGNGRDSDGGAATNSGGNQGGKGYRSPISNTKNGDAGGGGKIQLTFNMHHVYIATDKTDVCSSVNATLRVLSPVSGVTYNWYKGGASVGSGTTFSTNEAGTYTVQAVNPYTTSGVAPSTVTANPITGVSVNTTNKTITITSTNSIVIKSGTCTVANSYENGTLLFSEDFGGNATTDPTVPTEGLASGLTTYSFTPNECGSGDGNYSLQKEYLYSCREDHAWVQVDDHTYPNDPGKGYFMFVNADYDPGQFYQLRIDNLCSGSTLYFSAWILNIVQDPDRIQPNLRFEVYDGSNPTQLLTSYNTDIIGPDYITSNGTDIGNWNRYGFTFPTTSSSVILKIINNAPGGNGNDLALDDIQVRFCTPAISLTNPASGASISGCDNVILAGNYTDDGVAFGNNLVACWEYSTTNDITNASLWSPVAGTEKTSSNGTISLSNTVTQSGYYRLVVANSSNINTYNCRAMSNPISVTVYPTPVITTSDNAVCTGSTLTLSATPSGGTWHSSNPTIAPVEGETYKFASNQTWVVPVAGYYYVEAWGGNGYATLLLLNNYGIGGTKKGAFNFAANTTLYIQVGKKGAASAGGAGTYFGAGGVGGSSGLAPYGGGGGSASGVLRNGTAVSNLVLAAGGGGGSKSGLLFSSGSGTYMDASDTNQSVAPSGGNSTTDHIGGVGAAGALWPLKYDGGGGGGGYPYGGYGGVSGSSSQATGGAGGMNYISGNTTVSGALPVNPRPANNSGDGYVIITYLGPDASYVKGTIQGLATGSSTITYSANDCTSSPKTVTVKDCFIKVNPQIRTEIE